MRKSKEKLTDLKNLVDMMSSDGNWNYDEYQFGLANGLILALSIFEENQPIYKDKPVFFIKHRREKIRKIKNSLNK